MGNTVQEKIANFLNSADKYLKENEYEPGATGCIKTFLKFFSGKQKSINEYSAGDFKEFFSTYYQKPSSFPTVKSRLIKFLKTMGEDEAASVLDNVEMTYRKNYIKDFDTLYKGIQNARFEKMPFLKYSPESDQCDQLTMGEVILYLAWIGVPQNIVLQVPLSAIDLDKKVVSAGKDYSFADIPQIDKIFTRYKNATTFVGTRTVNGKTHFVTCDYHGNEVIRTKKQANNHTNIKTLLTRVFSSFGFAGSYFNVYRSGQLNRGYQKLVKGQEPDFTSPEKLWEYFGATLTTDADIYMFKKDWFSYLDWIDAQK